MSPDLQHLRCRSAAPAIFLSVRIGLGYVTGWSDPPPPDPSVITIGPLQLVLVPVLWGYRWEVWDGQNLHVSGASNNGAWCQPVC